MSESFYEIKESMTKEHKKFLLELKETYEASLKNLKREETEAIETRDKILHQLREYSIEAKKVLEVLDKAGKEKIKIDEDIVILEKEKKDWAILRAKEEEGFREHLKQIALDTEAFDKKSKLEIERIQFREKELLGIKADNEVLLKRNEVVLSAVKKADEDLSIKIQRFEDTKQEVLTAEAKLAESIKNSNELLGEIGKQREKNRIDNEEITKKLIEIDRKTEFNSRKEQELNDIEKKQNDREVDQNFRDIELRSLSDKVHKLIEIHKLEVK